MFTFSAPLWVSSIPDATWFFVTVPQDVSDEIDAMTEDVRRGFGSVKVEVTADDLTWSTSLFPDRQREAYVLPIKKQVRTHVGVVEGDPITLSITVLD